MASRLSESTGAADGIVGAGNPSESPDRRIPFHFYGALGRSSTNRPLLILSALSALFSPVCLGACTPP